MKIEKNGKVYQVKETDRGWTLKDTSDDNAPVLKISKGFVRDFDDLCRYVAESSLY